MKQTKRAKRFPGPNRRSHLYRLAHSVEVISSQLEAEAGGDQGRTSRQRVATACDLPAGELPGQNPFALTAPERERDVSSAYRQTVQRVDLAFGGHRLAVLWTCPRAFSGKVSKALVSSLPGNGTQQASPRLIPDHFPDSPHLHPPKDLGALSH